MSRNSLNILRALYSKVYMANCSIHVPSFQTKDGKASGHRTQLMTSRAMSSSINSKILETVQRLKPLFR